MGDEAISIKKKGKTPKGSQRYICNVQPSLGRENAACLRISMKECICVQTDKFIFQTGPTEKRNKTVSFMQ
ncbi:hypothetical protein EP12_11455 [Alteromonas australica]|nr:hypothetical protein EP12_11455 [Alteromonas australica]MAO30897.1 hypothetical protein [Alteromonas sp.]HBF71812.1 hypothetical protein [Alteromonas australica]